MRGGLFHRLSIRHKLVAMIMTTSGAVLLLASLGYLGTDYYRSRNELLEDLTAESSLVLENSTAALQFRDPEAARETLETLGSNSHIRTACMYLETGQLFAEFKPHPESTSCPASPGPPGHQFSQDRLQLVAATRLQGKDVGWVLLRSDLELLETRLRVQGLIVAVLLVLALGVALVMSSRLQSIVSGPLSALARTASDVSARGDYSVRAERRTDDELGTLVDAFNRMLERIQLRETELSNTNQDLRREIEERRRVEQERAALLVREREANRLKDEFLATLSHELRTPLNAILGWTRLLRANAVPEASVERALEKVERNAQVQSRLVEDLLDVSRIASGKLRLDLRSMDLVALTVAAIDAIRPAAESRGVSIRRTFDTHALPTRGDPDRLQQVIWNLLLNAVKFTPAEGVVTVGLRRLGDEDELTVSDTGIGIDAAFLPNVFEAFRQADASTTRSHGGLGLGLSIVKRLTELHGGSVKVASEGRGRGATFSVRLPVRGPEPLSTSPPAHTAPPDSLQGRLLGTRFLVVDDEIPNPQSLIPDPGSRLPDP